MASGRCKTYWENHFESDINVEPLCCIPETNTILKNKKKFKNTASFT